MLQFSHDQIIFQSQTAVLFTVSNHNEKAIIFKIKTTNTKAVQIATTNGFIEGGDCLTVPIKSNSLTPFQAKLQFVYASIQHIEKQFVEEWNSLKRSQLSHKQITIRRVQQSKFKRESQKIDSTTDNNIQKQIREWEERFQEEKVKNDKLKQELQEINCEIRKIHDERLQTKVNKGIGIVCQQSHTPFKSILILAIASLLTGFLLSFVS